MPIVTQNNISYRIRKMSNYAVDDFFLFTYSSGRAESKFHLAFRGIQLKIGGLITYESYQ
ncbi:Hypothetical protein ACI5QL_01513 [Bacillus velezensis]